jgi:hypothetical protein
MKRLVDLTVETGLAVDLHLVLDVVIPIHAGIQAQGDLIVIPRAELGDRVAVRADAGWAEVPPGGVDLLRGGTGGNAHTLVADPGTCLWTADVRDDDGLAIAIVDALAPAYLLHREHGGTGLAAGTYVIRRQRELVPPAAPIRRVEAVNHRTVPRAVQAAQAAQQPPRIRLVVD